MSLRRLNWSFFCCCVKNASAFEDAVDETSRLIPPSIENTSTSSSNLFSLNQERLTQRLVTIVRDKERKMVNVTSQIPFNLHNQQIPAELPHRSASRSVSLSAYRPSAEDENGDDPPNRPRTRFHSYPSSPLYQQSHSQSRSSSGGNGLPNTNPAPPILNVRLVGSRAPRVQLPERVGRSRYRSGALSISSNDESSGATPRGPTNLPERPPNSSAESQNHENTPPDPIVFDWGDT